MPSAVVGLIGAIVVVALPTVAAKVAGAIVLGVVTRKLSRDEYESQLAKMRALGQKYNVRSAVEPLPVVYGRVDKMPGIIVFQRSHGNYETPTIVDSTQWLTTVVCWSEGVISGYGKVWLNSIASDDARFAANSTRGQAVYVANYIGTDDQAADPRLVANASSSNNASSLTYQSGDMMVQRWTPYHTLSGVAYSTISLWSEDGLYGDTGIPLISADVLGKVCYDPRNLTTYWTRNPALHALDFLRNTRYGAAIPDSEIDMSSFALAASYCDEKDNLLSNRTARYYNDLVADPKANWFDTLSDILASCRGSLVYAGGTYKLLVDRPQAVTFALNEDNITGAWTIAMDSLGERVNRVTATYIDAAQNNKPNTVTVDDAAYRIADGGELLERSVMLSGVTGRGQAYDIALWEMRQSRLSMVVEVNALLSALRCEVGDVVSVTHSVPGWTAKPFRVTGIAISGTDEVRLTLREYSDTVYSAQTDNADPPIETTLPNPLTLPTISVINTTPRIQDGNLHEVLLRWTYPDDYGARWFEIQWIADSTSFPGGSVFVDPAAKIYKIIVSAADTFWANKDTWYRGYVLTGLQASTQYAVRMRAVSSIGGVGSWGSNWLFTTLDDVIQPAGTGSEIILDPTLRDQSQWVTANNATWSAGGGPDGGNSVLMTPNSAMTQSWRGVTLPNVPVAATGNTVKVSLVFRRENSTTPAYITIYILARVSASESGWLAGSASIDLSSYPVGEWITSPVLTIGQFSNPVAVTDGVARMQIAVYDLPAHSGTFSIGGLYAWRA